MNTEHYKAASERTDADERALTPAFKRTTPRSPSEFWHDKYCAQKAHADKLAEALRDILDPLGQDDIDDCWQYRDAKAALAAYEAAQ